MSLSTESKLIGLYWYCSEYHNGMSDWKYQVLSTRKYNPSPMATKESDLANDFEAENYYDKLVVKFEGAPILDTVQLDSLGDEYEYVTDSQDISIFANDYGFGVDEYEYLYISIHDGEVWEIFGSNGYRLKDYAYKIYDRKLHFEKIDRQTAARNA